MTDRQGGYRVQHQDEDVTVKVNAGWSGDRNGPKTDFIISERGHRGDHRHIAIDERGETITDHYRRNDQPQVPPTPGNPNGYDQSRY